MLIVGKSDKDVDDSGGGFRDTGDRERREGGQRQRDPSWMDCVCLRKHCRSGDSNSYETGCLV